MIFHTISSGDTLWDIARKYRVRTSEIKQWNGIDEVKPGLVEPIRGLLPRIVQRPGLPPSTVRHPADQLPAIGARHAKAGQETTAKRHARSAPGAGPLAA